MAMWPGRVCERVFAEGVRDLSHRAGNSQLLPIGGGNARAFLAAMLERIEAEIGEVRGLRVAEDAEDTALVFEWHGFGRFYAVALAK